MFRLRNPWRVLPGPSGQILPLTYLRNSLNILRTIYRDKEIILELRDEQTRSNDYQTVIEYF